MARGRALKAILAAAGTLIAVAPAAAQTNVGGAWSFISSALRPASVAVTSSQSGTAPGYIFAAPISFGGRMLGQPGPLILDGRGNPVWSHPLPHGIEATDFRPQVYQGKQVLTWWQGNVSGQGIGSGEDVIVDSSYHQIARFHAANGYSADLHELRLTPSGTALITAYKPVRWSGGQLWDSVVQEIDPRTGRLLFQWDPLSHIALSQSYTQPVSGWIWDPYHVNSIDIDSTGNLLVSARNTWALYKINRHTGAIMWQLGGKSSTFKLEPGVRFAYQHHARFQANNELSLFDNGAAPKVESQSRALIIRLDLVHSAAHVVEAYTHSGILSGSQGDVDLQPNGNVFVGWGQSSSFSEYTASGRLVYDAHFHGQDESYRTYRSEWVGRPASGPALSARASGSSTTLYASWNGETGIASWEVLAGASAGQLHVLGTVGSQGFETTVNPTNAGPYFQIQPLDAGGNVLGASSIVRR